MTFTIAGNGADGAGNRVDSFRTSERIADSVHRTVDRVAARAAGVEYDLRTRIAALRAEAREQEQRARAVLSANIDRTLRYARQQPLVAVSIAFAAGIALSGLFGRR
jgi:ElaB/YqjD/DUF883 family membrane-anchored ribosome-binding protein